MVDRSIPTVSGLFTSAEAGKRMSKLEQSNGEFAI
jgi:hypothetical protein